MKYIVTHTKNEWEVIWLEEHNASSHIHQLHPPLRYSTKERAKLACEKLNEQLEKDLHALGASKSFVECDV